MLWKKLISRFGGRLTNALDVSSLSKITDGYTQGHLVQAIEQILTERRIQQVGKFQVDIGVMFYLKGEFNKSLGGLGVVLYLKGEFNN